MEIQKGKFAPNNQIEKRPKFLSNVLTKVKKSPSDIANGT